MDLKGKKLLILGGSHQHCKLVTTAQSMGIEVIVTDYLKDSPAKLLADKVYNCDIMNIDELEKICLNEHVDGVLSAYIDPCQIPYLQLCSRLGLPCYGTKEQFKIMTNKNEFKTYCKKNNVDFIKQYSISDIDNIIYPVCIKPADSRGSRGITICYNKKELLVAIDIAQQESKTRDVIIEEYIENAPEVEITYFFINGKGYLERMCDSYPGNKSLHMEMNTRCAIAPSKYLDKYIQNAHNTVLKMFENMGIKNGPIFMQGFFVNNSFKFFDPGLRFPGIDYENILPNVFNINILEQLIIYSITGKMDNITLPENFVNIKGKKHATLFPVLKAGIISSVYGDEYIKKDKNIFTFAPRYSLKSKIDWTYDINQRFGEIDILENNLDLLKQKINFVQQTLKVKDDNNEDLIFDAFDTNLI